MLANPDDDDSGIGCISAGEFKTLVENGTVAGGMIPKLENSFNAIRNGVEKVVITKANAIDGQHGTVLRK